jgi:hypothetical protein
MIELANAPRPKPLPVPMPPKADQPVAAAEREPASSPVRVTPRVQSKPITAFGQRT